MATLVFLTLGIGCLADFVLELAYVLLDLASGFLCLVASDFADNFLRRALDLVLGTFNAIVIHAKSPGDGVCGIADSLRYRSGVVEGV
jgi:hypothetical protein